MELLYSNNACAGFLAEITRAFQKFHGDHYLGRTAMQKLVYFCQATGVPIPCSFEIYNYGPYSDEVKFAVDSLVADDVLMDRSAIPSKYSNYRLTSEDPEFDETVVATTTKYRPQVERVVAALGVFKPEQLELIATLHFVASKRKSIDNRNPDKERVISEFKFIKGNKFEDDEIEGWYNALVRSKLLD